jgi:hypothetical protein
MLVSRVRIRSLVTGPLLVFAACTAEPVLWTEDRPVSTAPDAAVLAPDGELAADTLGALASRLTPPSSACVGSLRLARASGTLYAVWWSPRPDSGARLLAARSSDEGTTWSAIAPVDTTDRGVAGCRRPALAIAADSASGYVHVSYALVAPEGPGLFFSHSMDGGATFHTPVPILYGDRQGLTSVAAAGDRVAVAFEDPNSATPRIGLALSRTMGHIFEDRILPVSDDNGSATHPLVAVRGRRITVAWQQRAAANGRIVFRIRTGTLH